MTYYILADKSIIKSRGFYEVETAGRSLFTVMIEPETNFSLGEDSL